MQRINDWSFIFKLLTFINFVTYNLINKRAYIKRLIYSNN
jgi:hypothetical protein